MKRFAMAVALMCALSTSIFAGEMPTTGKSAPSPTPSTSIAGDMPTTGTADPSPTPSTSSLLLSVVLTLITLR